MVCYLPLSLLKEKVPYPIMDVRDYGQHIYIQLRKYNFPQFPVDTLLLNPKMVESFIWAVEYNKGKNEEYSIMHFKYYRHSDEGLPIVRVSGKRFFKYLLPSK
jgi:hypothetical protein